MDVKKSVGIWVRVSTDMQGDSPEHHLKRAEYYIQAKEGWEVRKVYQLEAVSGKTVVDVPEFKQMLSDIKKGYITGLVFSKLARVARNTKELLDIADYFREHNADLISLDESLDTSTPAGRFFYTIIAAMAEWERAEISARVAASVPIRAKLGKSTGGAASFGYQWDKINNKLVLNETEAPIRRLVYEIFINCKRKKATAAQLNKLGYRTRKDGLFSDTTIDRLIRDPSAKGLRRANYTKSRGKKKHWDFKSTSDWILVPCPAIVSEDIWNECNDYLNAQQKKRRKPGRLTQYLLAGFVQCTCGKKMYVFHETRLPAFTCKTCKHRISVVELDEIYHAHLKSFLYSDEDISKGQKEAQTFLDEKIALFEISKTETEKLEEQMNELVTMRTNKELSPEDFAVHYQPLKNRSANLKNSLIELEGEIDVLKVQHATADVVLREAKDLFTRWYTLIYEQKRTIVELITDEIVIDKYDITISLANLPTHHPSSGNGGKKQRNFIGALPFRAHEGKVTKPLRIKPVQAPLTLGEKVRNRRIELGLLQKDVAKQIWVSEDCITYWENNRSEPQVHHYPKIIDFLGYYPFKEIEGLPGKIKKYRYRHGLSQTQMGEKVGVDGSTICSWETGLTDPKGKYLLRLQRRLNK